MAAVYDDQELLEVSLAGLRKVEMSGVNLQSVGAWAFEDPQEEDIGKSPSPILLKTH
jgi:hypothetical protein